MTEEQFKLFLSEFNEWQNATFPEQSEYGKLYHLKKELQELHESFIGAAFHGPGNTLIESEFADCFLLLFAIAMKCGYNFDDIKRVMSEKQKINITRTWEKPNADGSVQHKPQP